MSIEVYRIDDRLVHGQVVVGWGQPLALRFIVLVDDAIVQSDWERELYRMGTPPEMDLFVESVESCALRLPEFDSRADPGLLVAPDVATMARLCSMAPGIRQVNVGGIHHVAGRVPRLPYVFLSPAEEAGLRALAATGVAISAQDVPGADAVPLDDLLARDGS
ncbi:MAG: PTS sugar transporter subunit IIB [Gemmatimonadaceae bacterium]|nr:PTS sugar transporter subunit IIB [Gemmatimonadaceae bacterium]